MSIQCRDCGAVAGYGNELGHKLDCPSFLLSKPHPPTKPHTLADGCCSAVEPCSHQQRDPTTICQNCKNAEIWALLRDLDIAAQNYPGALADRCRKAIRELQARAASAST